MKHLEYKYLVAAVYVVGLFTDRLDTVILNVAPAPPRQSAVRPLPG